MREIKFRGWSGYEEWDYGVGVDVVELTDKMQKDLGVECIPYLYAGRGKLTVEPKSIGQYTGSKDTSDIEIYERDIVEFCDFDSLRTGGNTSDTIRKAEVVFMDGSWFVKNGDYENFLHEALVNDSELKVIGNTFENKELLEEK